MGLRIVVFYGSVRTVRTARQGIKAARFIVNQCRKRGHDVDLIDPREYPLPLVDKMCKEYEPEAVPAVLQRLAAIIKSADAYIIVSGEYNHTIPPALSNLLDYFLEEYFRKPSAIVCSQGGLRRCARGDDTACHVGGAGHVQHPLAAPGSASAERL
jgi:NAD(P)H-dependent FMN reductase